MNALADNAFTRSLNQLGQAIAKPEAILCVSAHWQTRGTKIVDVENPQVIYDFQGFPEELYQVEYPVVGSPEFAKLCKQLIPKSELVQNWGIDHGTWTVLKHLFPKADIPTFQISMDLALNEDGHYQIGKYLKVLREKGVLIIGSGNIVHNLRKIKWQNDDGPYAWCTQFDEKIREAILAKNRDTVLRYRIQLGEIAQLSVPTDEHFLPLLYCLGAADTTDVISFPYEGYEMGSLSMRCVHWSEN